MHGPLSEIGLADVLQLLERGRRSGSLRVVGPDPTTPRTLGLQDGRIVMVHPDATDDAVTAGLVARSLASASGESEPVPPIVREALRRRLAARALSRMMYWNRGRFDFEERTGEVGPLTLSPDALVLAMVAAEDRRATLGADMAGFQSVPDFGTSEAMASGPAWTPGVLDWRILDAVDGIRDVATMAALLGEPIEDVAGAIQVLVTSAILVLSPPLIDQARRAIEAENFPGAITLLRHRLAVVPDDADAWRALGLAEAGAGHFDAAIDAWTAWQGIDPAHLDDASMLIHAARTMDDALREP
ncbi:MAG: DUF4388 domain-containing protein [Gemmatimonadales bacterium]